MSTVAERTYKLSAYNLLIPLQGGEQTLIFNTLSRAFAVLSAEEAAFLELVAAGDVPRGEEDLLDRLIVNGYLAPADVDELEQVEKCYTAVRTDEGSLMLTIAPTLYCNFGCDYCFQGLDKAKGKMSEEVMQATLDYVNQSVESIRSFHVTWYGGEPLLGLSVIEDLSARFIETCDRHGVQYSAAIVTNGYALNHRVAEVLRACRVNVVQITIDGAQEHHDQRRHLLSKRGTYARIVENMASWIDDIPVSVNLRVNIDARNQGSIFALIDDLDARGLGGKTIGMYFAPVEATTSGCSHVSDLTMTKSDYAQLETALYQYAYHKKLAVFPFPPRFMGLCGALRPKALVVTPSGDVHKCWDTVSFPHQRVGSILDTATLESNPLNAAWNAWTPFANSSCRNCKILPTCAGSCAYKFVHASETHGEAAVLPCPSWKFSIKERLLQLAHLKGVITAEQIPPGQVTDPSELCCFEPTGPVEGLPDKILAAKAASYARANRRVIALPVLTGPREAGALVDAAIPAW